MEKNYHFRFEDLEIWKQSIDILEKSILISFRLEKLHFYRFADQLRGAALSISNNIAEGSGSRTVAEFIKYLGFARASVFECANIMFALLKMDLNTASEINSILSELDNLSRKITSLSRYLAE